MGFNIMKNYKRTIAACFFGIASQAVVINVTAVLFVHFIRLYDLELWHLGAFAAIAFTIQIAADIILSFMIDRCEFRPLVLTATALCTLGLLIYGCLPFFVQSGHMFAAIIAATIIFAFASGMCEVLLSPIIDNIPEGVKSKNMAMSMMHSFYAWGQLFCIIVTSLYLYIFGAHLWGYIIIAFAALPLAAFLLFLTSPLDKRQTHITKNNVKKTIFSRFFIIALAAILLGGGSEVVMNQWVSTFLVEGAGIDKTVADLFGMGLFAVGLGTGRLLYGKFGDKFPLGKVLTIGSFVTFLLFIVVGLSINPVVSLVAAVVCGFTTSLLWPGTLSIASGKFPMAGAWLFAVLAVSGDIGAAITPAVMGFLAGPVGLNNAFLIISIIPLGAFFCHIYLLKKTPKTLKMPKAPAIPKHQS